MNLARLKRRAKRRVNAPNLDEAIFGGRWPRFLLRRAGFPVARSLLSALLHVFEAAAMAMLFEREYLTPLVSARLTLSISGGVLWAGTEGVRRDVRAALGAGARGSARSRLGQALRRAAFGAALSVVAGFVYVYLSPHRPGHFTVVDAYILASCLRIASSFPVRVMQAGAHAVRRVYRPFASFLLPDILDGLSIFILWRWFGPWSVPIGIVLVGLLKLAITLRYTANTLRQLKLAGPSVAAASSFEAAKRSPGSSFSWWVAGAAQTAPSWIVLVLWNALGESESMAATLWVLYAIRPIAALLPRLGGVFYVDLVRARQLGELAERRLLQRLRRFLGGAGLCLGIAVAFATQDLVLGAVLLSFYSVNGLFGLESVRVVAFALPKHSLVSAALAMVPASLLLLEVSPTFVVAAATASFALGFFFLRRIIPRPDQELDGAQTPAAPAQARPLSLIAWLSLEGRSVTTLLECSDSHRVARHLATNPLWKVTRLDRTHLLVFGPPSQSWPVETAGLIKRALPGPADRSSVEGALNHRERHGTLRDLAEQLHAPARDTHVIAEELEALSASIVVLTPKRGSLSGTQTRDSIREARRSGFLRGSRSAGALWEDGRMSLVAVASRSATPAERAAMRQLLFRQSVARLSSHRRD